MCKTTLLGLCILWVLPAIAATHKQGADVADTLETRASKLANFCLTPNGDVLACDESDKIVRLISTKNQLKAAYNVPFNPQSVVALPGGGCVVAGPNKVAILGGDGKITKSADLPNSGRYSRSPSVTVMGDDIFVCARASMAFSVYRLDKNLGGCTEIIKGLRGCCGCMDIASNGKELFVAENARHHVMRFDREGKKLGEFGKRDPESVEGFGGCCEPKNICFDAEGNIYTSESDTFRVKRFDSSGKCAVIGVVKSPNVGCLQVTIAVGKDGTVYFCDNGANIIRTLVKK